MAAALRTRDIGRVFRLLRQYAGASQTQIAIACGMTQGKVSETMKEGGRHVIALDVFERIADGLQMPDHARVTLGLAPRSFDSAPDCAEPQAQPPSACIRSGDQSTGLEDSAILGSLDVGPSIDEGEDPLRRRTFHHLAGASLFATILADLPGSGAAVEGVEAFTAALTGHPEISTTTAGTTAIDLSRLKTRVAAAKRDYQACRFSTVSNALPGLLTDLRIACESLEGHDALQAQALSAEAHHVAASILLKLDDRGLAWLAADRSTQAARISQDPIVIGCSARIMTHVLMNDGHHGAATAIAVESAERLDRDIGHHTPDSLSVFGALLLRGAVAAGQREDRATAPALLDEAEGAAHRLGGDHNHRWTAFGPTNVKLHRVSIALLLGDAGAAIHQARTVDLDRVPLTERKATLLLDSARALTQWGKHEKAYELLRMAHRIAPEEISARPTVHRTLRDLAATAPLGIRRRLREFSTQIGVRL